MVDYSKHHNLLFVPCTLSVMVDVGMDLELLVDMLPFVELGLHSNPLEGHK